MRSALANPLLLAAASLVSLRLSPLSLSSVVEAGIAVARLRYHCETSAGKGALSVVAIVEPHRR